MNDINTVELWFYILCGVIFVIAIGMVISNNYVKRNRMRLFEMCNPLSEECRKLGFWLNEKLDLYNWYVKDLGLNQTYKCSISVVSNAENNNVKYLMKYSNVDYNMMCMEKIDFCIEYMSSINEFRFSKKKLHKEIKRHLPIFIRIFATEIHSPYILCNVNKKFEKVKKPIFKFLYISPKGNSRQECAIEITMEILQNIKSELAKKISKSGHTKEQRSAMTNDLREAIKKRDNYTCCNCGNSVLSEPNLLLEVNHIIPIAKGGKTEASNLQTLCWKCNRAKGDK